MLASTSDLPIYSIGAVERMLGIPAATVRNWEDRYGLVQPERSGGGHRLYTRAQVEHLRFVKDRLDGGLQPAEAHRLLGEELERGGELRSLDEGELAPRLLILLAERDPYAAEFAEFFLQTEGYEVVLALECRRRRTRVRATLAAARRDRTAHLRGNRRRVCADV